MLPIEALHRIAELSLDISALACSCRLFRAICAEVCPDLLPKLHSHQRAAVRSMIAREAPHPPLPHPFVRRLPVNGGLHVYADCASGYLSLVQPPPVQDVRGGLFCDEPGLGKTVTALGLILKTLGMEPVAPAAAEVRAGVASDPEGLRRVHGRFYMARVDSLVAEARAAVAVEAADGGAGLWEDEEAPDGARSRSKRSGLQSRKDRAAVATPRLMLSRRNRILLEDLELIPRVSGGGVGEGVHGVTDGAEVSGDVPGFVGQADAFVGGAPRNVEHFKAVLLQFCIAHNLTPHSLNEIPVLRHLFDRLRPRGSSKVPRSMTAATPPDPAEVPRPRRGRPPAAARPPLEPAASPPPAGASRTVTICRPHATARVTVLRRECCNWMKTMPSERHTKRTRNQTPAAAAAADSAAATDRGMQHAEALMVALGFVPAPPAAAPATSAPAKHSRPPEATPAAAPAMSTKRSPGRPPAGPSPHFGLPEPLRSCPSLRLDVPALEEALLATSDAYASVAALEPVPLSSATLIVVPSILIDHWSLEIAKHVRPGSLRVYFLESGKDADIPAHRLAWDYDVVMTTFSHLSSHGGAAHLRDRNLRHVVLQVRALGRSNRAVHTRSQRWWPVGQMRQNDLHLYGVVCVCIQTAVDVTYLTGVRRLSCR